MIKRQFIEKPSGPQEIEPVRFVHEGGGPHRSCDACLSIAYGGDLVHAAECPAALAMAPKRDDP